MKRVRFASLIVFRELLPADDLLDYLLALSEFLAISHPLNFLDAFLKIIPKLVIISILQIPNLMILGILRLILVFDPFLLRS